jgi:hypothetical protein
MPIDLDRQDVPKWVQLADYIRARIDDGTYSPRSRIPSEQTFTQETGFAATQSGNPSRPSSKRAGFTSCEDSARSLAVTKILQARAMLPRYWMGRTAPVI